MTSGPEPLSATEYQRFYDYGVLPERFFDEEAKRLAAAFLAGDLSVEDLEEELDAVMGR